MVYRMCKEDLVKQTLENARYQRSLLVSEAAYYVQELVTAANPAHWRWDELVSVLRASEPTRGRRAPSEGEVDHCCSVLRVAAGE